MNNEEKILQAIAALDNKLTQEVGAIHSRMDAMQAEITSLRDEVKSVKEEMNARFDEQEKRFDAQDRRFDAQDKRMDSMEENLKDAIMQTALTMDDIVNAVSATMDAREEPIYQALEENRSGLNLLAKPFVMPPVRKAK